MNKETFFALFEKQQPSVNFFYKLLENKTPETFFELAESVDIYL